MNTLRDCLSAARLHQWIKNTVCLAGLIFAGKLTDWYALSAVLIGMLAFCFGSSAVYIFNDIMDRQRDKVDPRKKSRAIASGRLSVSGAAILAIFLIGTSLLLSWQINISHFISLGLYLAINIAYSLAFKHWVLLDVMCIAIGFVLRVQSGIEAIQSPQSPWIIICMFFLALFLGFSKRRGEILFLNTQGPYHRPVLDLYSEPYLNILMGITAAMAIMSYALYTVTIQSNETFVLTILPVVYGILRYMLLVIVYSDTESPDRILMTDWQMLLAVAVWIILSIAVLYGQVDIFAP